MSLYRKSKIKRWMKLGLMAAGLAAWYSHVSPTPEQSVPKADPLPAEIKVIETSIPHKVREKVRFSKREDGSTEKKVDLEKIVRTSDIDFSKDFYIKTDRYNLIKTDDWWPSRQIGHLNSMITKLLFWDWDVGWGLDANQSRTVLSILEENKDLKGITVRINHTETFYDTYRLFADKNVEERNNWLARLFLGVPSAFFGELQAELRRGDCYIPLHQTAILYSNVKAISGHEIGHHKDFQRFSSDWEYSLTNFFPPTIIYKEWQATKYSREFMGDGDKWQFNRYLIPALLTYILGGYYISRQRLQKRVMRAVGDRRKDTKGTRPRIHPSKTLRHFASFNGMLYAGLEAYSHVAPIWPEPVSYGAFLAAMIGTKLVADKVLGKFIPYDEVRLKNMGIPIKEVPSGYDYLEYMIWENLKSSGLRDRLQSSSEFEQMYIKRLHVVLKTEFKQKYKDSISIRAGLESGKGFIPFAPSERMDASQKEDVSEKIWGDVSKKDIKYAAAVALEKLKDDKEASLKVRRSDIAKFQISLFLGRFEVEMIPETAQYIVYSKRNF